MKRDKSLLFIDLCLVIVVHEIPVDELYHFLFDETKAKETTVMFGVMWFLHRKGRLPSAVIKKQ